MLDGLVCAQYVCTSRTQRVAVFVLNDFCTQLSDAIFVLNDFCTHLSDAFFALNDFCTHLSGATLC